LRLLAVVSAPVVGATVDDPPPAPLNLWLEWHTLEQAIQGAWDEVSGQGAPWAVIRLNPPTSDALGDALAAGDAERSYQVVHFSSHGAPEGMALEDELGRMDFVSTDELVQLFRGSATRLVFLNACQTVTIADRLVTEAGIPAVIAMTDSLRDDEARILTQRLYARLAREQCVGTALSEALAALERSYRKGDLPIPRNRTC
jgi:CHAT domain-containing protein